MNANGAQTRTIDWKDPLICLMFLEISLEIWYPPKKLTWQAVKSPFFSLEDTLTSTSSTGCYCYCHASFPGCIASNAGTPWKSRKLKSAIMPNQTRLPPNLPWTFPVNIYIFRIHPPPRMPVTTRIVTIFSRRFLYTFILGGVVGLKIS